MVRRLRRECEVRPFTSAGAASRRIEFGLGEWADWAARAPNPFILPIRALVALSAPVYHTHLKRQPACPLDLLIEQRDRLSGRKSHRCKDVLRRMPTGRSQHSGNGPGVAPHMQLSLAHSQNVGAPILRGGCCISANRTWISRMTDVSNLKHGHSRSG